MALDILTTDLGYWSQGIIQAGRKTGPKDMLNALLDEAGDPYRRSGSTYKSTSAFGSTGLRWIWDGSVAGEQRTFFASTSGFGMLAADDASVTSISSGITTADPRQSAVVNGALFVETSGSPTIPLGFGGTRKAAYSAGTITLTYGSTAATGTGTAWVANVDAGMVVTVSAPYFAGVVESVSTNTSLTLTAPWAGTTGTFAYALDASGTISGSGVTAGLAGLMSRLAIGTANRVHVTAINDPWHVVPLDYHEFPASVRGLGVVRDSLMVFTDAGAWAVSGMANELTDENGNALRRQEIVSEAMRLWHRSGLAHWNGALIVPAIDGVWLMDTNSAPVKISAAITDLYDSYVNTAGYRPGGATVIRNHYVLPIIDSSANAVDLLVCRLIDTRSGRPFTWTRLSGSGANVTAVAARDVTSAAEPLLLGAGRQASSRVLSLPFFDPVAARKQDHDATTHQYELQTGDLQVSNGRAKSFVKRAAAVYELVDAATDNPTLDLSYQIDGESTWHLLTPTASEDDGSNPFTWNVGHYAHRIRFRLRTQGPPASMKLRTLEVHVRRSGKT